MYHSNDCGIALMQHSALTLPTANMFVFESFHSPLHGHSSSGVHQCCQPEITKVSSLADNTKELEIKSKYMGIMIEKVQVAVYSSMLEPNNAFLGLGRIFFLGATPSPDSSLKQMQHNFCFPSHHGCIELWNASFA
jgi:hypothetical protein